MPSSDTLPGRSRSFAITASSLFLRSSSSTRADIVSYEVQQGDTVGQLATQFGVSVWTILSANNLDDPDMIQPGMKLRVLPVNGVEHEVQLLISKPVLEAAGVPGGDILVPMEIAIRGRCCGVRGR